MKESTRVFIKEHHDSKNQPLGRFYLHLGSNMGNGLNLKPLSFQEKPDRMYLSDPYFDFFLNEKNAEDVLKKILNEISESFDVSPLEALQLIANSGDEGVEINSDPTEHPSLGYVLFNELPREESKWVEPTLSQGREELAKMVKAGSFFREKVVLEKTTQ